MQINTILDISYFGSDAIDSISNASSLLLFLFDHEFYHDGFLDKENLVIGFIYAKFVVILAKQLR